VAPRVAPLAVWAGHVPPAAARAAATGGRGPGVLAAVRDHPLGSVEWDDVGRMLYLADFLEPGRDFAAAERADLAQRVPTERDAVLREVARRRLEWVLRSGWPVPQRSVDFWNHLVGRSDGRTAGRP